MENKKCKKALLVVGGIALTAVGFIVIPPLLEKYSAKMYKSSLEKDEIDFDNLGPEIVPIKKSEEEEEQ